MNADSATGRDGPSFPSPGFPFELFGSKVLGRSWVQNGPCTCTELPPAPSLMAGTRYAPEQKQSMEMLFFLFFFFSN